MCIRDRYIGLCVFVQYNTRILLSLIHIQMCIRDRFLSCVKNIGSGCKQTLSVLPSSVLKIDPCVLYAAYRFVFIIFGKGIPQCSPVLDFVNKPCSLSYLQNKLITSHHDVNTTDYLAQSVIGSTTLGNRRSAGRLAALTSESHTIKNSCECINRTMQLDNSSDFYRMRFLGHHDMFLSSEQQTVQMLSLIHIQMCIRDSA